MALTEEGMRAFRSAATLVGIVPRARVRIRHGDRTVLTVSQTALCSSEAAEAGHPVMAPCHFRVAVAHAYRHHSLHGAQSQFLDGETDPAIDVGLPPDGLALPGGIYRTPLYGERHLFVFVSTLGPKACQEALTSASTSTDPAHVFDRLDPAGVLCGHIGLHGDPAMCLTAVHAVTPAGQAEVATAAVGRLLEICTAAEIIADVRTNPPSPWDLTR